MYTEDGGILDTTEWESAPRFFSFRYSRSLPASLQLVCAKNTGRLCSMNFGSSLRQLLSFQECSCGIEHEIAANAEQ